MRGRLKIGTGMIRPIVCPDLGWRAWFWAVLENGRNLQVKMRKEGVVCKVPFARSLEDPVFCRLMTCAAAVDEIDPQSDFVQRKVLLQTRHERPNELSHGSTHIRQPSCQG